METLNKVDFRSLGTGCRVMAGEAHLDQAVAIARYQIDAIDFACSRFREDSELSHVNRRAGYWVRVSPLFMTALHTALRAARETDGIVDPTVGQVLKAAGYDRDFASIESNGRLVITLERVPGWRSIEIDEHHSSVRIHQSTLIDFGATAKALAADLAAQAVHEALGISVLVSLGGDIAVAGEAPEGGWLIDIADAHNSEQVQQTVAIIEGGLATSSTTVRTWNRGGDMVHHIINPATAKPADVIWRTVSVAATSCVDANIATTAAVVLGYNAEAWLEARGFAARLLGVNGDVVRVNGWPE